MNLQRTKSSLLLILLILALMGAGIGGCMGDGYRHKVDGRTEAVNTFLDLMESK